MRRARRYVEVQVHRFLTGFEHEVPNLGMPDHYIEVLQALETYSQFSWPLQVKHQAQDATAAGPWRLVVWSKELGQGE
jgi:hypothetical protein